MNQYQYILSYSGYDSGNPQTLTIEPAGWNESGIEFVRNLHYHSIFRSYSDTIKFARKSGASTSDVGGGGDDIILYAYSQDGIEAIVNCTVNKRNPQTNDYDLFYSGILDFKPENFSWDEEFVEISFIDGQKENLFKIREELNYDLNSVVSTDGTTVDSFADHPKPILFTPINIYGGVDTSLQISDTLDIISPPGTYNTRYIYYIGFPVPADGLNEIGDRYVSGSEHIYENTTGSSATFRLDTFTGTLNYTITYDPQVSGNNFSNSVSLVSSFLVVDENDTFYSQENFNSIALQTRNDIVSAENYSDSESFNFSLGTGFSATDYEITVPDGHKLKCQIEISLTFNQLSNMQVTAQTSGSMLFGFTEISTGEPSEDIDCFFPHEAFSRLIQLMTSETDETKLLYSQKLGRTDSEFETYGEDGDASNTVIVSGWNLRKFPSKPFNVNMRDLFKSYDALYNLGLGYDRINDRFYIEEKSEFYNSGLLMFDLGEVQDLVIKPYSKGYFSKINGGYEKEVKYDEFQGANIYCVKTEHSTTTPVKSTLDAQSKYSGDSIGMELARRLRYKNYKSQDSDYDENIYIVNTASDQVVTNGTLFVGFEGLDEFYNKYITPRECLLRWGNVLSIPMWKKATYDIKFVKSQKGVDFNYLNINGDNVNELDDIAHTEITDEPLFIPELASFKSKITTEIMSQLNTNPHGLVKFASRGTNYYGFIERCKTEDYNRKAEWEIIIANAFEGANAIYEDGVNIIFEDDNNKVFET